MKKCGNISDVIRRFFLIELLVAVAIAAVFSAAIWKRGAGRNSVNGTLVTINSAVLPVPAPVQVKASETKNIPWVDTEPIAAKLRASAAAELSRRDVSAGLPEYVKRCFSPSAAHEFEIFFVGTGADDFPAFRYGKPGVRGYSSVLLNGKVLIDVGVTAYSALKRFGVDVRKIEEVLFTHSHRDHCYDKAVIALLKERKRLGCKPLICHGEVRVINKIKSFLPEELAGEIICKPCKPYEEFTCGKWKVVPVPANHVTGIRDEQCLHFVINGEKKKLFYALDGAWLCTGTWRYIRSKSIDMVIWDGALEASGDRRVFVHNDLSMVQKMIVSLTAAKAFHSETIHVLSHLSLEAWDHPPRPPAPIFAAEDGMKLYL